MRTKPIDRLIMRMQSEGKDEKNLQNAYQRYRALQKQINEAGEDCVIQTIMSVLDDYGKAFSNLLTYLQALVDSRYISREYYIAILREM